MLTLEEFIEFYHTKGYVPGAAFSRPTKLNTAQLSSKYKKYCIKYSQVPKLKVDETWTAVREEVRERDLNSCRLLKILTFNEKLILLKTAPDFMLNTLDCAHSIFTRRGKVPRLKYFIPGIVLLNRFSHSNLDNNRCPLTGELISNSEVEKWWHRILTADEIKRINEELKYG